MVYPTGIVVQNDPGLYRHGPGAAVEEYLRFPEPQVDANGEETWTPLYRAKAKPADGQEPAGRARNGLRPAAGTAAAGAPWSTVVLAVLCACCWRSRWPSCCCGRPPPTAAPAVTVTPTVPAPTAHRRTPASPTPTVSPTPAAVGLDRRRGTDATERADEPAGVRDAATHSCRAWLEPSADDPGDHAAGVGNRQPARQLADVDPAKIPKAKPVGELVVRSASDFAAVADQKMSDRTTVRMQLVYEPASRYGWLVDTVGPLE